MKKLLILSIALFAAFSCNNDKDKNDEDGKNNVTITTLEGSEFSLSEFGVHTFPAVDKWVIEDQRATTDDFAGISAALEYISANLSDRQIELEFASLTAIPDYAIFGTSLSDSNRDFTALNKLSAPHVTTIGVGAFEFCDGLTSVEIDALESVEFNAFNGCTALESIDLKSVTFIGSAAFSGCKSLKEVDLTLLESIENRVFYLCQSLTEVTLPATITSIGESAFAHCSSLVTVDAPAVASIGDRAFNECSLLESVNTPLLQEIGQRAFTACRAMESYTIVSTVTTIGNGVFNDCDALNSLIVESPEFSYADGILYNGDQSEAIAALQGVVTGDVILPGSVIVLQDRLFYNCSEITSIEIPSVTTIGSYTFGKCHSLLEVELSAATELKSEAFYDCLNMTSLSAPRLTTIGSKAFYNCEKLTKLSLATAGGAVLSSIDKQAFYASDISKISLTLGSANAENVKYGDTLILGDDESIEFAEISIIAFS